MIFRCIIVAVLLSSWARADESDEVLAYSLSKIVRDPRAELVERVAAAKMIAKLGPRASNIIPELTAQLARLRGRELEPLQEAVIDALTAMGKPAASSLPQLARTTGRSLDIDLALRRATEEIIYGDDSSLLPHLLRQLSSKQPSVRLRAVKAMADLRSDKANLISTLTSMLLDSDSDVRRASLSAIRQIDPKATPTKEWVESLVLDLKDSDDSIRLVAVRNLAKLGSIAQPAIPALEALLADPDRDVRKAANEAIARISQ